MRKFFEFFGPDSPMGPAPAGAALVLMFFGGLVVLMPPVFRVLHWWFHLWAAL